MKLKLTKFFSTLLFTQVVSAHFIAASIETSVTNKF